MGGMGNWFILMNLSWSFYVCAILWRSLQSLMHFKGQCPESKCWLVKFECKLMLHLRLSLNIENIKISVLSYFVLKQKLLSVFYVVFFYNHKLLFIFRCVDTSLVRVPIYMQTSCICVFMDVLKAQFPSLYYCTILLTALPWSSVICMALRQMR